MSVRMYWKELVGERTVPRCIEPSSVVVGGALGLGPLASGSLASLRGGCPYLTQPVSLSGALNRQ